MLPVIAFIGPDRVDPWYTMAHTDLLIISYQWGATRIAPYQCVSSCHALVVEF